jgi:hypothetical protein
LVVREMRSVIQNGCESTDSKTIFKAMTIPLPGTLMQDPRNAEGKGNGKWYPRNVRS